MSQHNFALAVAQYEPRPLHAGDIKTLQINVGKRCNQACLHCHVDAGPNRTENMERDVADKLIALITSSDTLQTVDLTGGAPELNPHFRTIVRAARDHGLEVIDRCNLTILSEPGQSDLATFLASNQVRVVASLPCYSKGNVDKQRGLGVFDKSIQGLLTLNQLGYGEHDSLVLDLVYNPVGPHLPPAQASLEADYRERLQQDFGITFSSLLTITNVPINRFAHALERDGRMQDYLDLLVGHFNNATLPELMCRSMISVGYDGALYDCDFNQMIPLPVATTLPGNILEIESLTQLANRPVATGNHCYACTAGAGSSCGGSLA